MVSSEQEWVFVVDYLGECELKTYLIDIRYKFGIFDANDFVPGTRLILPSDTSWRVKRVFTRNLY